MKTHLSIIAVAGIFTMMITNNANGQFVMSKINEADSNISQNSSSPGSYTDKNYSEFKSLNNVNINVVRDFVKRFGEKNNAVWHQAEDGGYIAKYTVNKSESTIAYTKNGKWMYAVKRYTEANLPKDVRAIVKSKYFDYAIMGVEEVMVPNQDNSIYILHIQDDTSLKIVRICDGEMDLIKDYIKG